MVKMVNFALYLLYPGKSRPRNMQACLEGLVSAFLRWRHLLWQLLRKLCRRDVALGEGLTERIFSPQQMRPTQENHSHVVNSFCSGSSWDGMGRMGMGTGMSHFITLRRFLAVKTLEKVFCFGRAGTYWKPLGM